MGSPWQGVRVQRAFLGDNGIPTSASMFEKKDRPAWLNWLFLGIFLFSSWQLAGLWFEKLHG